MQQQSQAQNLRGPRLSTSSHSSTSLITSPVLNGLLLTHRASQTLPSNLSVGKEQTSPQTRFLQLTNDQIKRIEKLKQIFLFIILTFLFAFLLITTVELAKELVRDKKDEFSSNFSLSNNQTKSFYQTSPSIRSFFASVWIFNVFLFFICLIIHLILYRQRLQRDRARAAFLR